MSYLVRCGVLVILSLLQLLSPAVLASDLIYEQATDSVWVAPDLYESERDIGEWQANGEFINYQPIFSPIKYKALQHRYRLLFEPNNVINHQFNILAFGTSYYTRNGQGAWQEHRLLDELQNLACRSDYLNYCVVWSWFEYQSFKGINLLYFQSGQDITSKAIAYGPTGWRDLEDEEPFLFPDGFIDRYGFPIVWNQKLKMAINDRVYINSAQEIMLISPLGRVTKPLVFSNDPSININNVLVTHADGDHFYVAQRDVDNGRYVLKLFRLTELANATVNAVLMKKIYLTAYFGSHLLKIAGDYLYYIDNGRLYTARLSSDNTKDLGACYDVYDSKSYLPTGPPDSLWFNCINRVVKVSGENMVRDIEMPTDFDAIKVHVIKDDNSEYEFVAESNQGTLIREKNGVRKFLNLTMTYDLKSLSGNPVVPSAMWSQQDHEICAVISAKIKCHGVNGWQDKDLNFGKVRQAKKINGLWWVISLQENNWTAYVRKKDNTWHKVYQWDGISSAVNPAFITSGRQDVAIDFNDKYIWVYENDTFVARYEHNRLDGGGVPAIDVRGLLYDHCQDQREKICAYTADGQQMPLNNSPDMGDLIAVGNSLLNVSKSQPPRIDLIRNDAVIDLATVYGQLKLFPSGMQVLIFHTDQDQLLFQKISRVDDDNSLQSMYLFDGTRLQAIDENRLVARFTLSNSSRIVAYYNKKLSSLWQEPDGLWHIFFVLDPSVVSAIDGVPLVRDLKDSFFDQNVTDVNQVQHAIMHGDQVLLATHSGAWTCAVPERNIDTQSELFYRTKDCQRLSAQAFFSRIYSFADERGERQFIAHQGNSIWLGNNLNQAELSKLNTLNARGLQKTGREFSWLEDANSKLVIYNPFTADRHEIDLPEYIHVNTAHGRWLCTDQGTMHYQNDSQWQNVLDDCQAMSYSTADNHHYVVANNKLYSCQPSVCEELTNLPRNFVESDVLGTVFTEAGAIAIALVMGNQLVRWDPEQKQLKDITPPYKHGSLILTNATTLDQGMLSLAGGGVVILPGTNQLLLPKHVLLK